MINLAWLAMFNTLPEVLGTKEIIIDDKTTELRFKFYNLLGLKLENKVTLPFC